MKFKLHPGIIYGLGLLTGLGVGALAVLWEICSLENVPHSCPSWIGVWLTGVGLLSLAIHVNRKVILGMIAAAVLVADVRSQTIQPLPAYSYDYAASILISMPDPNAPDGEHSPLIVGAVCGAAGAVFLGYVAIKIISAILNIHEHNVTNDAAKPAAERGPCSSPVPNVTDSPAEPACSTGTNAPAAFPLPLVIEHSFDNVIWSTVSYGVSIGQEVFVPDTGFWRARVLPLRIERFDGQTVLHCPPGVLEHATNLGGEWIPVAVHSADADVIAQEGFYRVRVQ